MSLYLHHRRTQRTVGQGFFHTGEVSIGHSTFRYVYDCGSDDIVPLRRNIRNYTASIGKDSQIDALFISHLHSDHVNGMDDLFSQAKVDTVYLPYLNSVERLLIVAQELASGKLGGSSYIELVLNPGRWFAERGTREVVFVLRGSKPPKIETGSGNSPLPKDISPKELYLKQKGDFQEVSIEQSSEEAGSESVNSGIASDMFGRDTRPSSMLDSQPVNITVLGTTVWQLITYVHEEKSQISKFKKTVESTFSKSIPTDAQQLQQFCFSLLQSRSLRDDLQKCYEKIRKDINLTSMSLYSGPLRQSWLALDSTYPAWIIEDGIGWIGTGDANLKTKSRRKAFLKHYRPVLPFTLTVTLPHHGSRANFDPELLTMGNIVFVASAGFYSQYDHPHDDVREAVIAAGKWLRVCTERPDSILPELFTFRLK